MTRGSKIIAHCARTHSSIILLLLLLWVFLSLGTDPALCIILCIIYIFNLIVFFSVEPSRSLSLPLYMYIIRIIYIAAYIMSIRHNIIILTILH